MKGYWRPIKISSPLVYDEQTVGSSSSVSLLALFQSNFISPLNIVHFRISFHPAPYNQVLHDIMTTCHGKIVDRVCLYTLSTAEEKELVDTDWFLVALDKELCIQEHFDYPHISTHVLMKLENKGDSLIHDEDIRGFMRLIPDLQLISSKKPAKEAFTSVGYILVNSLPES